MYLTTRGLILRVVNYKDADKILTVLTETEGKITLNARGVRRRGSRYAAATQLLCYSEMTLFGNRGRWTINEAETLEQFLGLREDIGLLSLGAYIAELLETVSDEDYPNSEMLYLGLNTLYSLSRGYHTAEHIKAAFELRLMYLSGFAPIIDESGIGDGGVSMGLPPAAIRAAEHILTADSKRIYSFRLEEKSAIELYDVCERYVQMKLERKFRALDYWKMVTGK